MVTVKAKTKDRLHIHPRKLSFLNIYLDLEISFLQNKILETKR
jgi:hypothetical protein